MLEFLVIGGGIAGISAAARLFELGSVCVLEAEDALGYHASGRSSAMYLKTYGNAVVCELNAASEDHLMTCAGGRGVLSPRGVLTLGRADQHTHIKEACHTQGTDAISLDDAIKLVPIVDRSVVKFAAYTGDARDLDTDLLIQDFAKITRANGGLTHTKSRVQSIYRSSDGWTVKTGTGEYSARKLVNAAGAWADKIAELSGLPPIGLGPKLRSMARIPAPDGLDVSLWPFLLGAAEDWYAKPDAGKLIISPADEDPQEPHDAFADDMVLAEGIARYEEMVTEAVTRVETSWAGLRTFAPDKTLVLGPDPLDRTFIWCAGQGGYGF